MFSSLLLLAILPILTGVDAAFDFSHHLGLMTPPFTPSFGLKGGLGSGMPEGCSVEQVQVLHRHGSRYPGSTDYPLIVNLSSKLNDPTTEQQIDSLNLPAAWKFVQGKDRWINTLITDNLTISGRKQNFDDGVKFRLSYPDLPFEHILAGGSDRVIESAQWFRAGMFGRYENDISDLSIIAEDNVTISSITPFDTCPNWTFNVSLASISEWNAVYLPPIQKRINNILKPVELTADQVNGAFYACGYELAAYGNTTWCDVFNPDEFLDFEYSIDLGMRGGFGYGLPNNMGPVIGSVYVNEVVDRLTGSTANKTYVEYGHDTSIAIALTGFGLFKDENFPASGPPNPLRKWRTSNQVHFASHLVTEKWNCDSSTQVRILLNEAPVPLSPICAADKKTGACLLDDFVRGTESIRNIKWGDSTWNSTCGNPGF